MKVKKSVQAAAERLGLTTLREFQLEPINSILAHQDTFVIAPTSAGKSAIYQIPAVINSEEGKWTLVIEPTLALIADQVNKLQNLGIAAEMMTSHNYHKHNDILNKLRRGILSILYVTPEGLQSYEFQSTVKYMAPWLLVVDEAHCVQDWGFTFRYAYLKIRRFIKDLNRRPVITAFTATAPPMYQTTIHILLGMKDVNTYTLSLARDNIILLKEDVSDLGIKKRLSRVNYNIKKYGKGGRIIVYCASRKNVDVVYNYLSNRFPKEVVKCHAYMDSDKREKHELQFIDGSKRIMVGTTAFGMGIDVPDIRLVIHFNLPLSTIDYYQQIGRAGRDGEKFHALLLYHPEDIVLNRHIIKKENLSEDVHTWLSNRLNEMVSIAESDRCLMQQLLESLGEGHPTTCRHCTNCQKARR